MAQKMLSTQQEREAAKVIRRYLARKVEEMTLSGDLLQAQRVFTLSIRETIEEIENGLDDEGLGADGLPGDGSVDEGS